MPSLISRRRRQDAFNALWQRYVEEHGEPISAAAAVILAEHLYMENRYFCPKTWSVSPFSQQNADFLNGLFAGDSIRFYEYTRMTRDCFSYVLRKIEGCEEFSSGLMGPKHRTSVALQLFTFCYTLGKGSDSRASSVVATLSHGSVHAIMGRVGKAIITSLEEEEIRWPNSSERAEIKEVFALKGFPNAIGCVDGTQVQLKHKLTYAGVPTRDRKGHWSLKAIVVCDHKRRITAAYVGFLGNAHDSKCFKSTPIFTEAEAYFANNEYLLGDAGFQRSPQMMTPVTLRSGPSAEGNASFNQALSSARSRIENVFGMVKQRWAGIDPLRVRSYERQLVYCKCAFILHNVCIRHNNDPLLQLPRNV